MIDCRLVQILLYTKYTLKQYYQKVRYGGAEFLEEMEASSLYKERCPLCAGKDCAEFLGCYYRGVVDERGTYYKAVAVFRYRCNGKGSESIVNHRTFSLLPYQLAPYTKYSIPFIINTLNKMKTEGKTIEEILNYWSGDNEYGSWLNLDQMTIRGFKKFVVQTIDKMLISGYYEEAISDFQSSSENERIKMFIEYSEEFCCYKTDPYIRGPCGIGYDYYLTGNGYIGNSHFLFGTPSQFRDI